MGIFDKFKKKEKQIQEPNDTPKEQEKVEIITDPREIAQINRLESEKIKEKRKQELQKIKEEKILASEGNSYEFSEEEKSKNCYAVNCNEENLHSLNSKNCKLCGELVCDKHVMPENHDCVKHIYVKYLKKKWLRKYGLNVSTGQYKVSCEKCGYDSEFMFIEDAGKKREFHIKNGCDDSKVFLEGME